MVNNYVNSILDNLYFAAHSYGAYFAARIFARVEKTADEILSYSRGGLDCVFLSLQMACGNNRFAFYAAVLVKNYLRHNRLERAVFAFLVRRHFGAKKIFSLGGFAAAIRTARKNRFGAV